ncbi:4-hydroxyphenylpyruvate dioxygenase [Fragilaria crotonensis]|nr:4-hydroxyphenylpyruvate dioxygenase [Fragilaria crotonensis]
MSSVRGHVFGSFLIFLLAYLGKKNSCPFVWALSTTPTSQVSKEWKPKLASLEGRRLLRDNQHDTEIIGSMGFHHIEFYCGDAKSMAFRFAQALGMRITGEVGQATGNDQCVSYALESGDVRLLFTAPYSQVMASGRVATSAPIDATAPYALPSFSVSHAHSFFQTHGLAAKAVGLHVRDAKSAFDAAVAKGATPVLEPTLVETCLGQKKLGGAGAGCQMAEVALYGDVVLRFVSYADDPSACALDRLPFLPHLAPVAGNIANKETYGIFKIDHAVGNVPNLLEVLTYVSQVTGFHEFAEFTADDVGTVESGLNSVVLASDTEDVLLPLNEPTEGRRKSQIQTYLEQNEGPGLQHLALKSYDIFATIRKMKEANDNFGGFELMNRPSDQYYRELPDRLGDKLSTDQYAALEDLGILADADDEGILLQVFTKPIGDRPTFFVEIIQRIGCQYTAEESSDVLERPGCGGFGRGNFRELFKSIEEHEKTLKV